MESLVIQNTKLKGKGVFATKVYNQGDLIEKCPVVIFSMKESDLIDNTILGNYWYSWNENSTEHYGAMVGGYGMFYNHSFESNAIHIPDYDSEVLNIFALKKINTGDEITLRYNTIWFDVRK